MLFEQCERFYRADPKTLDRIVEALQKFRDEKVAPDVERLTWTRSENRVTVLYDETLEENIKALIKSLVAQ